MVEDNFIKRYLSELNEQQLKAVQSVYGPVLLLAVPGSGKTTVLIKRLGYMIYCQNIVPSEMLVVTYTVSATEDMKKRYISYFGDEDVDKIEFRTINGICAKILVQFERNSGRKLFDLADDSYINRIISMLYQKYENAFPNEQDIISIRTAITYIKNMMLEQDEILLMSEGSEYSLSDIYEEYIKIMKQNGMMDYDDQMRYALNLLKAYPDVLESYQNKYKFICVDEAQDTSKIQHEIIRLLASKHENLFMVGDEDQSIYGFRAAYPEALLEFEKIYKNATVLLMETNYRSNGEIVTLADDFIQHNILRHKKKMIASREYNTKPKFISVSTREEQYSNLLNVLKTMRGQIAVLYRNNDSMIPLVDVLNRNSIPFNIKNADLNFFNHKTIVDIRDFITFAYEPANTDVFMRIYYKMTLYLTKGMAANICSESKRTGKPILQILSSYKNAPDYTKSRAGEFISCFKRLTTATSRSALMLILEVLGYRQYLERSHISDNKIEILQIMSSKEKSLVELLNRLTELEELIRNKKNEPHNKIILNTMHSSKGLEYDNVYIIDVTDGILPEIVPKKIDKLSEEDRKTWEEERRLFYVAMTRAKDNLFIYDIFGSSVFIKELKQNIKERKKKEKQKEMIKHIDSTNYSYEEFTQMLGEDILVRHKTFGEGRIVNVNKTNVKILFNNSLTSHTFNIRTLYSLKVLEFI